MGSPWINWNWQTERDDVLVLFQSYKEEFEQPWALFSKWTSAGDARGQSSSGAREGPNHAKRQEQGNRQGSPPPKKGKRSAIQPHEQPVARDPEGDDAKEEQAEKTKAMFKKAMLSAQRTKKSFQAASSTAQHLIHEVQDDPSWGWANNAAILGEVQRSLALLTSNLSSFDRTALYQDLGTIKKSADPATGTANLWGCSAACEHGRSA